MSKNTWQFQDPHEAARETAEEFGLKPKRKAMNKYGAKKTVVDGIKFDSGKEAARYRQLCLLQRVGQIRDLQIKVKYQLIVNGVKIGRYTSDFEYEENGRHVVEDVKSKATKKARDYGLRKKLMLAIHGIKIRET